MGDVTQEGRTVLFVSHNMAAVQNLCSRAMCLSQGSIDFVGSSYDAIEYYLRNTSNSTDSWISFSEDPSRDIDILSVMVVSPEKGSGNTFDVSDGLEISIEYLVRKDCKGAVLSLALSRDGILVFRSWDTDMNKAAFQCRSSGRYVTRIRLPEGLFAPGLYSISIVAGRPRSGIIVAYRDCLVFEIENIREDWTHMSFSRGGMLVLRLPWEVTKVTDGKV
jgi:lipopolysaccharide transport system ATP-binding protein